jgi:hypothetical protein
MFAMPISVSLDLIIILLVLLVILTIVLVFIADGMGRETIALLRKIITTIDETKKR